MSEKYLLNALPSEFIALAKIALAKDVIDKQVEQNGVLCDNNNTTDEHLAKIVHRSDGVILQSLLDKIDNPHQTVVSKLYVLSQNADGTETTLQNFGKPIPQGETIKWVFLAQDFDEACAIKNRLMGFAPYEPMPTNIAINEHYVLKKEQRAVCVRSAYLSVTKFWR